MNSTPVEPHSADPRFEMRVSFGSSPIMRAGVVKLVITPTRLYFEDAGDAPEFPLSEIRNVHWHGQTLSMDTSQGRLSFDTASAAACEELARYLPATRTVEFEETLASQRLFAQQLAIRAPRVWVASFLLYANIAVFLAMVLSGVSPLEPTVEQLLRWGANYRPLSAGTEPWRLLTSTFIHIGLLHLFVNGFAIYRLGPLAERLFGSGPFTVLYLFSGVMGSLTSHTWSNSVSAGASGAVFGILGAILIFVFRQRRTIPREFFVQIRGSLVVVILLNVIIGLSVASIDNAAHMGGLIAGALAAWILGRPLPEVAARPLPEVAARPLPAEASSRSNVDSTEDALRLREPIRRWAGQAILVLAILGGTFAFSRQTLEPGPDLIAAQIALIREHSELWDDTLSALRPLQDAVAKRHEDRPEFDDFTPHVNEHQQRWIDLQSRLRIAVGEHPSAEGFTKLLKSAEYQVDWLNSIQHSIATNNRDGLRRSLDGIEAYEPESQ